MTKFISLFSGAGGLDLGLSQAGMDCAYASDIDPEAMGCLERNFSRFKRTSDPYLEVADVRKTRGREVLAKCGLRKGDVRVLAGGPPCQSWSSAGHQLGFSDPRGRLIKDYVRIANELDVEWIILENVRGLLTARGQDGVPGSALDVVRKILLRAGFQTEVCLLNAADFGVPQRRIRLFIIGFRSGLGIKFPSKTHSKNPSGEEKKLKAWVTLGECLGKIKAVTYEEIIKPRGKISKELESIEPGSGVKSPGKKETTRPGGHWGYKQGAFVADLSLPARTVTASSQQDWIIDSNHALRRLCPRECAAIQTFPPSWKFVGSRAVQYRLIGNAVPPLLAKRLGKSLLQQFDDDNVSTHAISAKGHVDVLPLNEHLQAAIKYTQKEEARNGASRRAIPSKRFRASASMRQ